jgi:transcriptional regulator with XRE-family HTH domain
VRNSFPLIDVQVKPTGYGWMSAPILHAYLVEGDPQDLDETGSRERAVSFVAEPKPEPALPLVEPAVSERPERPPEASAVDRLAALTGLEMEKLADLLGVSRATLYAWRGGAKPRGSKRDHLHQVAAVMEEVAQRVGGAREVAAWLLTPSAASNRRPCDILRDRRYDICRSMLTRRAAARVALPQRAPRMLSPSELRHRLDQVSRKPSVEDYERDEERED